MTDEERAFARDTFNALVQQFLKLQGRIEWLDQNRDHLLFDDRCEAMKRSSLKFGRLNDELAEWAGVGVGVLLGLLEEIAAGRKGDQDDTSA